MGSAITVPVFSVFLTRIKLWLSGIMFDNQPVKKLSLPRMKITLTLCILLFSSATISAQTDSIEIRTADWEYWLRDTTGSLVVHQDDRISALMDTLQNVEIPLEGYRIQLSFGRKEEVNTIRTAFLQQYPDYGAYISWLQPNFRLRVGDFRTRLQAERFLWELREDFQGSYIVRDEIELPPLED